MKKIEHIGVAVKSVEKVNETFKKLLGKSHYKIEEVESEFVKTSFFEIGETKLEFLEATDDRSAIAKYLTKNREGVHHLALAVDNLKEEMARLKNEGFEFITETPKAGADNKLIAFLHPKSTGGLLIELCQERE